MTCKLVPEGMPQAITRPSDPAVKTVVLQTSVIAVDDSECGVFPGG